MLPVVGRITVAMDFLPLSGSFHKQAIHYTFCVRACTSYLVSIFLYRYTCNMVYKCKPIIIIQCYNLLYLCFKLFHFQCIILCVFAVRARMVRLKSSYDTHTYTFRQTLTQGKLITVYIATNPTLAIPNSSDKKDFES